MYCLTRRQVPPVLKSTFIFRTLTPNENINDKKTYMSFFSENCPQYIQSLMKKCWQFQSENRCTFNEIVQELQGKLEQGSHNLFINPGN